MIKKKLLSGVFALAICLSLTACGSRSSSEDQPAAASRPSAGSQSAADSQTLAVSPPRKGDKDTLVVRTAKDVGDLNPHTMKSQNYAQDWVYESLVAMENGKIVPQLAENWEVSPDGLTYTFHLRKDVKFSDGSPFTSALAKRNIEAVQHHADGYSFLQSLTAIDDIRTPDDWTLVLKLNKPCNSLLNDFTFSRPLVMLGEKGFPSDGDPYDKGITAPIGTGMWKLKEYVPDQFTLFERNENYWGDKPAFQYLKAVVIPDVNTAANAMKAGEIDVMVDATQITADLYRDMGAAGFKTGLEPTTSISNLNINTADPVSNDLNVRLAMEYATDSNEISKGIFGGLQAPATAYFSTDVPYTDTGIRPYEYDLERAERILEEGGWTYAGGDKIRSKSGQKLELDLIYDSSVTNDRDIGLILQSQYAKAGIQLNIVPQDSQVYRKNWALGQFGVLIYSSWGGSYEPYATLAAMASDKDKFNTVQKGMSNQAELNKVMIDCLSQTDSGKLQKNFDYIMKSFHDEAVYVPLTVVSTLAIYRSDLTGLNLNSSHGGLGISGMRWTD